MLFSQDALAATEESNEDKNAEALKVLIIGTLFKNQALKPNILKEISDDQVLIIIIIIIMFISLK